MCIQITLDQLKHIYKDAPVSRLELFLPYLNKNLPKYDINTRQRIRMFLAQVGHESGQLRYVKELGSGESYNSRKDLGNIHEGDGPRYKGRGLMQITGRNNYALCGEALQLPLLDLPELLEQPPHACESAAWFWHMKGLNPLADDGMLREITRRINGGYNGYADRYRLYQLAGEVI